MNKIKTSQLFYELGNHTGTVFLFRDLLRLQKALVEEASRTELEAVCELLKEMCQTDVSEWSSMDKIVSCARYAPSITIRSESELLGVSMPRFSIRVYLDLEERFVINLRRKESLIEVLKNQTDLVDGWSGRKAEGAATLEDLQTENNKTILQTFNPITLVKNSSWFADCFIEIPHWIQKGEFRKTGEFKILSHNWGELIGEPDGDQTIYVEGLHLSGVCSQMGIFMASAAMGVAKAPLSSVAEITFLLGDRGEFAQVEEFIVTEATPPEIIRYFEDRRVKLLAQHQFPNPSFSSLGNPIVDIYGLLIRSYVMSNAPVMLIGDRFAFWELWTNESNRFRDRNLGCLTSERVLSEKGEEPHVCCVIGCSLDDRDHNKKQRQFIIHDPAAGPYLTCSCENLYQAVEGCYGGHGSVSIISVVPREITLSFCSEVQSDSNEAQLIRLGVYDLAEALAVSVQNETNFWVRNGKPSESEFRLVKFCDLLDTLTEQLNDTQGKREILINVSEFLNETDRRESENWCWLQFGTSLPFVLLWNAEKRGPELSDTLLESSFLHMLIVEGYLMFGSGI